jgi:hypothetical protein
MSGGIPVARGLDATSCAAPAELSKSDKQEPAFLSRSLRPTGQGLVIG